jgi:DNA-binding beta-propeller fold protein YncE
MTRFFLLSCALLLGVVLNGCATKSADSTAYAQQNDVARESSIKIPSTYSWGGEARCNSAKECYVILVEHEASNVVLYKIENNKVKVLDKVAVAYHPDSAKWINDNTIIAAVEASASLDVFQIESEKLKLIKKIDIGFQPRDILVVASDGKNFRMVATPYSGKSVVWVDMNLNDMQKVNLRRQDWCGSPWHPAKATMNDTNGLIVSCLDSKQVLFVKNMNEAPIEVYKFENVPRMVKASPSGKWLYVALELGGRNARIHTQTREFQWLDAPGWGGVSIEFVTDGKVIWGDDKRVFIQDYDETGKVLTQSQIPASGFPTMIQYIDINSDGEKDLIVFNETDVPSDIYFGPIEALVGPVRVNK